MNSVRIILLNTKGMEDVIGHSPSFASKQRIEKSERYLHPRSRILSYGAELALSYAMSGSALCPPVYEYDARGKPVLSDGRFMSLSHSGTMAVCAISDAPIGVDIEKQRIVSDMLKRRVLTKREQAELADLSILGAKQRYLLQRWVQKESYLKLTGEGLSGGMTSIECIENVVMRNGVSVGYVQTYVFPFEAPQPYEGVMRFLLPKDLSLGIHYFFAVASILPIKLKIECVDVARLTELGGAL